MSTQLTLTEKRYIDNFLKSVIKERKISFSLSFTLSAFLMLLGLFLLVATCVIVLQNITDRVIYFVFIPGTFGGLLIMVVGTVLMRHLSKSEEKRRLAEIIKKLIAVQKAV